MGLGEQRIPPKGFLAGEGLILVMFFFLVPTWDRPQQLWRRFVPRSGRRNRAAPGRDWRRTLFLAAFVITFGVQFVALTPLLDETGGPIDSPYIQLALAFAVFTQILANELHTMVIGLLASIAYYWVMIEVYEFGSVSAAPEKWVYGAVTTLIVLITVGLAVLDRLDSERTRDGEQG
jgi:hypothetical protein